MNRRDINKKTLIIPLFSSIAILLIFCIFQYKVKNNNDPLIIKITKDIENTKHGRKIPERLIPLLVEKTGRHIADYQIKKGSDGNYQAISKRHNLSTSFNENGISIKPLSAREPSWTLSLNFKGIGYENNINKVSNPYIVTIANEIKYLRGDVTEWYVNSPFGLEQGFTVYTPPTESPLHKNLVIEIEYDTTLKPILKENKKEIIWNNKNGNIQFNYSKLLAYDSDRKVLPSYMTVSENNLLIHVDDHMATYPITIDPILIQETLIHTPSDPDVLAKYGQSVGIDNDVAVVGSPGDNDNGDLSGSSYVHLKDQGGLNNWGELKKITPLDASACKIFGFSVDVSGDIIAVGANTITTTSACPTAEGAVYLFTRNQGGADNWGQIKKLVASDSSAGNQFGFSVTIDGDILIVGAPGDSGGTGSAYVYQKDQGGVDNWGEVTKITPSDGAVDDSFGLSTAISSDTAVIGAPAHFGGGVAISGAAYIFDRNQGGANNWGEVTKITASDAGEDDVFGIAVSIDGDTVVVGAGGDDSIPTDAGSVYFFGRDQGGANNWGEVTKLTASDADDFDALGSAVTIQSDLMFVGSPGDDDGGNGSGAFYGSELNGSWAALEKFTASDAGPSSGVLKGLGVFEVDDTTGNRTIVSDNTTGSGNLFLEPEGVAVENPGPGENYLIADKGIPAIISVDPGTGNQSVYEDNSGSPSIPFILPIDLDFDSSGDLFVTDPGSAIVMKINTTNGNRSIVNNTGNYPSLGFPFGIAVENSGNVVVTDLQLIIENGTAACYDCAGDSGCWDIPDCLQFGCIGCTDIFNPAVARINSSTGVVQELADTTSCIPGRPFNQPLGISLMLDDNFAVVAIDINESTAVIEDWAVIEVNSTSGACSIIADDTTGTGPDLLFPEGIATMPSGELAVVDNFRDEVLVIDPATGNRTILSGNAIGNGPQSEEPFWIAINGNGDSIITDQGTTGINFGSSIDISGRTAIIGAPGKTNLEGGIYIFQFCEEADPGVSASPVSQAGAQGDNLSYTVTVQNNCTLACSSKNYNLSGVVPNGWTSSFSPSTVNLNPGETTNVTWNVSSAAGAPVDSYQITAQAVDSDDSTFNNLFNATYDVDNNPPTTFCGDGTCDAGEDCNSYSCPSDCISGGSSGAVCGNGICEAADSEDCNSCPSDCNEKDRGKNKFCCGKDGLCSNNQCNNDPYSCTEEPAIATSFCCGDGTCEGNEDSYNCEVDCGPPPSCGDSSCDAGEDECSCAVDCGAPQANEVGLCNDGADNDCDGDTDCIDSDCAADSACSSSCSAVSFPCSANQDCCSNRCKGKTGAKVCK